MENHPITIASAILKIQSALWETPSTPFDLLIAASTLLSKPDYDDVITERTISGLCGYPMCPNPLPSPADRRRKGKYRISLSEHRVYDLEETYSYCCEECLIGSRALKGSLSDRRMAGIDVKKSKVEGVLRLFGYFDGEGEEEEEGELSRRDGVGKFKLEIKEKDGVRAGDVKLDEWIGPSNAIEGYVPQLGLDSKYTSNLGSVLEIDRDTGTEVHIEDKGDGVLSCKPSTLTNDVSEIIAKQLQDVSITELKTPSKKSSKSSKPKPQTDAIITDINNVDYGNAGFTSSIIFGNESDVELSKKCDISTRNASEQIAKQLEDVVITEKTAEIRSLKSPRSKSKKKASNNKSDSMDFQSTIVIGNSVNAVPLNTSHVSSVGAAKQSAENSQDNVVKNKAESMGYDSSGNLLCSDGVGLGQKEPLQDTGLKSSLKTSQSKGRNRFVTWADQGTNEATGDKEYTSHDMHEEDSDTSLRLASAEACAAALSLAAEAVAAGEAEAGDAVSEAGIVILPQPRQGEGGDSEADEEAFEFDRGVLKWPKKTVFLDTDMFDVDDSWHDTPPEGFSLTLSSFATMWMALFGWITCSSIAYIYGHDDSSHEEFLVVNGREYPRKIFIRDGKSSEIRQALDGFICRALPGLVMDLKLPTPVSTLEKFVGRLFETMTFVDAVPSLKMRQWQLIVMLFIEALSVHRLPSLAPQMTSRSTLVRKVLSAAQVSSEEYETMRDLIMPLGRLPQFSMQSGG